MIKEMPIIKPAWTLEWITYANSLKEVLKKGLNMFLVPIKISFLVWNKF